MPLQKDSSGRQVVPTWINSAPLPISPDRVFPVKSSLTGDTVHYAQSADQDAAAAACEAAWTAFHSWKRSPPSQRRTMLLKVADLFEERKEDLIKAQVAETSCDRAWATTNVMLTVAYVREIAACVSSLMGHIPMNDKPDTMSFVFRDPVGPVLTIPPWNAALVLATRAVSSAVGAGCTVVFKASELSPLTHHTIVEIFEQAGCPKGVINQVQVMREDAATITEFLIANERIRKIEFIGSAAVGRIIGSLAAKHLKPVLMELGGKCPAIVLDDADLQKAAGLCAAGSLLHHGQICFSTERIIVHRAVAEKFQTMLADAVKSHGSGGAAVHEGIARNAHDILQDAKANGSTFLVGDGELESAVGMKPAIILNPKGRIVDEETFGPSASLYVVEDDAEAIALANKSAYGLNATIHSQNMERALRMARELEYGQVHVNSISVYTSPTAPQGGVKGSGWGRQNAGWGLSEFLQEKFVSFHGKGTY